MSRSHEYEAGRVVVEVNPAYSSKTCSGCGFVFEHLTLKDRWITCRCGLSVDRDHNAAINILKRAGSVRWGCGVRRSVVSPLQAVGTWEMFLGHPANLSLKRRTGK